MDHSCTFFFKFNSLFFFNQSLKHLTNAGFTEVGLVIIFAISQLVHIGFLANLKMNCLFVCYTQSDRNLFIILLPFWHKISDIVFDIFSLFA